MSTELIESPRNTPHIGTATAPAGPRTSSPPNLLERIALHVGMALIIWGRHRGNPRNVRESVRFRREAAGIRCGREREYERDWLLTTPPR